ncbi:beta-phosphoglucomutase [Allofournierella sp.]|uniref:beta-phosphoglucomutase n=1 Tax=Allofournierella sp. TaxID=1940256 RepID=UPI003AB48186
MKGIIFDLDGVICRTDEYHYQAWKQLADRLGIPFDAAVNHRLRGVSRAESLNILLERSSAAYSEPEKQALADQKNRAYCKLLQAMSPADLPQEVKQTLQALRARGLRLAIGSSSKNAPLILQRLGLERFFDAVADGAQIARSKPDPEVFLLAARKLGLAPADCLVVEDAQTGIRAAKAGGFAAAALGDACKSPEADFALTDFRELLALVGEAQGPATAHLN